MVAAVTVLSGTHYMVLFFSPMQVTGRKKRTSPHGEHHCNPPLVTFGPSALHILLLVTTVLVATTSVFTQILPFHHYTAKDGLPSNEVRMIMQDSPGYMWIVASEGLSRYDASSFVKISIPEIKRALFVSHVVEDRDIPGCIWIFLIDGTLCKWYDGHTTLYTVPSGSYGENYPNLLSDHEGRLWMGTGIGLFQLQGDSVVRAGGLESLRDIRAIHESSDSIMWILTPRSLFRYMPYKRSCSNMPIPGAERREVVFEAFCVDSTGCLWVAASDGKIYRVDDRNSVSVYNTGYRGRVEFGTFSFLEADREGNIWAGSSGGLFKIRTDRPSGQHVVHYTVENGLPANDVSAFCEDHEGNYWVGLYTKGIAKLSEKESFKFSVSGLGVGSANNSSACGDSGGHIWVVEENGLAEAWRDGAGEWRLFHHDTEQKSELGFLTALQIDRRGLLWTSYSGNRMIAYAIARHPDKPSTLTVRYELMLSSHTDDGGPLTFIVDSKNRIWLSRARLGVEVIDPTQSPHRLALLTPTDGLPGISIRALCEDRAGNIWFGDYAGGLGMLPAGNWKEEHISTFSRSDGLPDQRIRSIVEDKQGRVLIGTRMEGLSIYADGTFTNLTTANGLLSNTIWSMFVDSTNSVWLGTDLGLQLYSLDSSRSTWVSKESYGVSASGCGLFRNEFIWYRTSSELVLSGFPFGSDRRQAPPVYIRSVSVNGAAILLDNDFQFAHEENNIQIQFVGLSYKDEDANAFQYRLLESDHDWQLPTLQQSVTYASLTPGSYTFEVKAISAEGIASASAAAITFTIMPPFWERWWFILMMAAIVAAIMTVLYRYRLNQLLQMERMRTRIATDLHDDIGASLTRIALFSEVAREEAKSSSPRLVEMAEKIGLNARELLDSVGTLVWSIDPRHDRFDDVITHLKNFAQEMLSLKGIDYRFTVNSSAASLPVPIDARKNILLIFKEAINNIVKHASCRNVIIELGCTEERFVMMISDDGMGMDAHSRGSGHGLANMRSRAVAIGGELEFSSNHGQGTLIRLELPFRK